MRFAVMVVMRSVAKIGLLAVAAALIFPQDAWGRDTSQPLQPRDRSSPRAAIATFLDAADAVGAFIAEETENRPSRQAFGTLLSMAEHAVDSLDLSQVSAASRTKLGAAAAIALYETLNRLDLPTAEQIPGTEDVAGLRGNPPCWVVPGTRIVLMRVQGGTRDGEFLFSPDTVAHADEFYERTKHLAYRRVVPLRDMEGIVIQGGGWMVPYPLVRGMPAWLRYPLAGDAIWKWIATCILLLVAAASVPPVYRLSRRVGDERPLRQSLFQLALPSYLLAVAPVMQYFLLVQVNLRGYPGAIAQTVATILLYVSAAWLSWRATGTLGEMIVSSPGIRLGSIDAHLARICARLAGIAAATVLLVTGASEVGVPVYGVVAGLGVGGLAIALAAQPTIENLIGGLNIFADRPIRVGHSCRYGSDSGTVESIGIRSTRIRGADQTITTVPNAMLSRMAIVNTSQRDRMLVQTSVVLPVTATSQGVRYCLARIQRMLDEHPMLERNTALARLVRYTGQAEIEVFAYVRTSDPERFLIVQEQVLMHVMQAIEQSKSPDVVAAFATGTVDSGGGNAQTRGRPQDRQQALQMESAS